MTTAQDAFARFVVDNAQVLLGSAWVVTGQRQEAEDVVQTVLARMAGRWGRLDEPLPYARRAVVNEAVSRRRRKRLPQVADYEGSPLEQVVGDPGPEVRVADADQARRWLALLPPRQRAVVLLRFWSDMTEAATARELGISVGTVKSQTARALATLRPVAAQEMGVGRA